MDVVAADELGPARTDEDYGRLAEVAYRQIRELVEREMGWLHIDLPLTADTALQVDPSRMWRRAFGVNGLRVEVFGNTGDPWISVRAHYLHLDEGFDLPDDTGLSAEDLESLRAKLAHANDAYLRETKRLAEVARGELIDALQEARNDEAVVVGSIVTFEPRQVGAQQGDYRATLLVSGDMYALRIHDGATWLIARHAGAEERYEIGVNGLLPEGRRRLRLHLAR